MEVATVKRHAYEVDAVDTILKQYKAISRAKINADKSVGLRVGSWRSRSLP